MTLNTTDVDGLLADDSNASFIIECCLFTNSNYFYTGLKLTDIERADFPFPNLPTLNKIPDFPDFPTRWEPCLSLPLTFPPTLASIALATSQPDNSLIGSGLTD